MCIGEEYGDGFLEGMGICMEAGRGDGDGIQCYTDCVIVAAGDDDETCSGDIFEGEGFDGVLMSFGVGDEDGFGDLWEGGWNFCGVLRLMGEIERSAPDTETSIRSRS